MSIWAAFGRTRWHSDNECLLVGDGLATDYDQRPKTRNLTKGMSYYEESTYKNTE